MCFFRFQAVLSSFEHRSQGNVFFSPCWLRWWLRRPSVWAKVFWHCSQFVGPSECLFLWALRLLRCLNDLLHSTHVKVFSELWLILWLFSSSDLLKDFWQALQLCGLSSLCVFWWFHRPAEELKVFVHWSQVKDILFVWILPMCLLRR